MALRKVLGVKRGNNISYVNQGIDAEMYSFNLVESAHDFDQIQYSDEKMADM
jgi:hypothetical protein